MDVLLLRFDAPMMSFGTFAIDEYQRTAAFPGKSLLTGLLGNALGYDHSDGALLQRLQDRIRYAVRRVKGGRVMTEYQTVDLTQPHLLDTYAWTSYGRLEGRNGDKKKNETHQRYRDFVVNSVFDIALRLAPAEEAPTLKDVEKALRYPARPLFLGRKSCLPSCSILQQKVQSSSTVQALRDIGESEMLWWMQGEDPEREPSSNSFQVFNEKDWHHHVHFGVQTMYERREG